MAKTFTYDKRQRSRQPPPQRSTWGRQNTATPRRGNFADIAGRVREHRLAIIIDQTHKTAERQKRPTSD